MDKPGTAICLISGNHLCHNPRVLKEADALDDAGYAVRVLGAWLDGELAERDRALMVDREWTFTPVIDFTKAGLPGEASRVLPRARSRLGRVLGETLGLESEWQLGYCAPELLRAARQSRAALYIAHSEQALWVAGKLLSSGFRVGVDMEDWFSEDLLPEARRGRPLQLLRRLEQVVLCGAAHASCPSEAMGRALAAEYGCRQPVAVCNAFAWAEREALDGKLRDRRNRDIPSLHWYSQTLGPGRGLEDLFRALGSVHVEMEVHLRGRLAQGAEGWLEALISADWKSNVFVHPLVSNAELLSRVAEHDIGFAGELKNCRSRDLTVTNKMFHYLLGGLAVVASDTEGQTDIARKAPGAVLIYPAGDSDALGEKINELLLSKERLLAAQKAALRAVQRSLSWEHFAPSLVRSVDAAVAR